MTRKLCQFLGRCGENEKIVVNPPEIEQQENRQNREKVAGWQPFSEPGDQSDQIDTDDTDGDSCLAEHVFVTLRHEGRDRIGNGLPY